MPSCSRRRQLRRPDDNADNADNADNIGDKIATRRRTAPLPAHPLGIAIILHPRRRRGGGGGEAVATVAVEEELLFHCAIGLRHVTLMRWDDLRPTFRRRVRDLCFAEGLGSLEMTMPAAEDAADPGQGRQRRPLQQTPLLLPRTVAMACLGCVSSFWKRGWMNTATNNKNGNGLLTMTTTTTPQFIAPLLATIDNNEQSYLESTFQR